MNSGKLYLLISLLLLQRAFAGDHAAWSGWHYSRVGNLRSVTIDGDFGEAISIFDKYDDELPDVHIFHSVVTGFNGEPYSCWDVEWAASRVVTLNGQLRSWVTPSGERLEFGSNGRTHYKGHAWTGRTLASGIAVESDDGWILRYEQGRLVAVAKGSVELLKVFHSSGTKLDLASTSGRTITLEFDGSGRLIAASRGRINVRPVYDSEGRLVAIAGVSGTRVALGYENGIVRYFQSPGILYADIRWEKYHDASEMRPKWRISEIDGVRYAYRDTKTTKSLFATTSDNRTEVWYHDAFWASSIRADKDPLTWWRFWP